MLTNNSTNSSSDNQIYCLIPCYNEGGNLDELLPEIKQCNENYFPVVINDHSSDNTQEVALKNKATVINLPINLGVGGAVQTGLQYVKQHNGAYAVKIDGDGQHNPSDLKNLLKPLIEGEADIVIGSRFINQCEGFKSTFFRRQGIKILQLFTKLLSGNSITDPTSGYRAYNSKAIEFMAENYPSFDYPEPEEVILAAKNNLRIKEVPVLMRNRCHGTSSISFFGSFYYMAKVILAMLFIKIR